MRQYAAPARGEPTAPSRCLFDAGGFGAVNIAEWNSRVLTNAVIGFAKGDQYWPNPLGATGWRVCWVEPLWNVDVEGTYQPANIRPDVVLFDGDGRVMLAEC